MRHSYHDRKKAYEMRLKRKPWHIIAKATYYSSGGSCRAAVVRYAELHHLPMPAIPYPITLGEMAYEDRLAGAEWWEVARDLNIDTAERAEHYAKTFCATRKQPWPPR